jgi:hypothetical protein
MPPRHAAIANNRLLAIDGDGVTFRWKEYRVLDQQTRTRLRLSVGPRRTIKQPICAPLPQPNPHNAAPLSRS